MLCLSLLFLRHTVFPKPLNLLGLLVAVLYFLIPLGTYFKAQPLLLTAAAVGALAGPIWYIWLGLTLRGKQVSE